MAQRLQDQDPGWPLLLTVLGLLTLARLIALVVSPSELGFDEAQYWAWSRELAWGYFTKPPLIGWVIAGETRVCGTGAACIRAASPLFHFGTALVLAALARRLYGPATGFWTGIFYAIMPGIAVSSFLITTDVFLLFFWSAALLALLVYLERPRLGPALLFALATGLGLYAKYAMIYLPVLALVAGIGMRRYRPAVFNWRALVAFLVILLLIAPNLLWNAENGFATFEHTAHDNIGWSLSRINAVGGLEFLGAQFGVAGPVVFGAMLNALFLGARSEKPGIDRLLMVLSWPILAAITVQGFLAQANLNWGATAYPAGVILATTLIIRHRWGFFFWCNLVVCGLASLVMIAGTAFYDPRNAAGPAHQMRQLAGWEETADNLTAVGIRTRARRVVVDGRGLAAGMIYALRDKPLPVRAYLGPGEAPRDQFELQVPWTDGDATAGTLLFGFSADKAQALGAHLVATIDAPLYLSHSGKMTVYGFGDAQ
ncbi:ArnT family glycosyltransferase [Jiella sp. M17.18]|uniref:ArnT family glycosyltransferase n=1 Tax=Jiella sp. M17.18 TaxID=3234247 RepID=UPI0034E01C2F